MSDDRTRAVERLEALGRAGLTVSVCCGPCGPAPFRWTVQVLSRTGEEFARPFGAHSFTHAIEIAELEIRKRGWLKASAAVDPPADSNTGTPPTRVS